MNSTAVYMLETFPGVHVVTFRSPAATRKFRREEEVKADANRSEDDGDDDQDEEPEVAGRRSGFAQDLAALTERLTAACTTGLSFDEETGRATRCSVVLDCSAVTLGLAVKLQANKFFKTLEGIQKDPAVLDKFVIVTNKHIVKLVQKLVAKRTDGSQAYTHVVKSRAEAFSLL